MPPPEVLTGEFKNKAQSDLWAVQILDRAQHLKVTVTFPKVRMETKLNSTGTGGELKLVLTGVLHS